MTGTLSAPCEHFPERHTLCHSTCGKYLAYRVDQLADTWAQVTLQNIGVDVAETGEQL